MADSCSFPIRIAKIAFASSVPDWPQNASERHTKMASSSSNDDDLRPEYDDAVFANAARGKYASRFQAGANLVRLAPDVAAAFPDEQSVNEALRFVQKVAQDAGRLTKRGG